MDLQRSSQAVVLCEAVLQRSIWIVDSFSLCTSEIQGGFRSLESVALHVTEPLGDLKLWCQLPCVQRNFKLWCLLGSRHVGYQLLSCPQFSRSSRLPQTGMSNFLSAADLLGCLSMWYLQRSRLTISLSQQKGLGKRGVVFSGRNFAW